MGIFTSEHDSVVSNCHMQKLGQHILLYVSKFQLLNVMINLLLAKNLAKTF